MADEGSNSRSGVLTALACLAGLCVIAGVIARFRGLGRWPFTIDEYYLAQSVQNVLREGLPRYACGGLYVRGLALQYASALLQYSGLSAELAPRLIAAVSSLVMLPAAYLLGRRLGGRETALLTIAILGISVWETEVARFGRMYAPFQAVFIWYVVYFLEYTLDRRQRALIPMVLLSVLGVLVWEGGVFLALANFLPPFVRTPSGRLTARDWRYLAYVALLFVPSYWLATADLRTRGGEPTLPGDYHAVAQTASSRLDGARMPLGTLHLHGGWEIAALVPFALTIFAAIRVWRLTARPLARLGLLAVLACALLQQFELAAALLLLMLVLSVLDWREILCRQAWPLALACSGSLVFWCLFGLATSDWHSAALSSRHVDFLLVYQFVRFPDFVRQVGAPWLHSVPVLSVVLFVLLGSLVARVCLRPASTSPTERLLLALVLILLLAAGASHPPRQETRYVFFLYPLVIMLAILAVRHLAQTRFAADDARVLATTALVLGGFLMTEDFQPRHLLNIDTEVVTFRIGMSEREASHYQMRSDVRSAAVWLAAHVDRQRDIVINSFPAVDFYYPHASFYFMEEADPRFEAWSCREGRFERWSNLPLLDSLSALSNEVASGHRIWLVMESSRLPQLLARLPATSAQIEWRSRANDIAILSLRAPAQGS